MNPPPKIPQIRDFPCKKCCGSGNVGYRRAGGVCFRCGGDGFNSAAWQDAMAVYKVEKAKWDFEKQQAEAEATEEFRLRTLQRIEAGEPVDWFERFIAGLPA
jgi:hypothetical protein